MKSDFHRSGKTYGRKPSSNQRASQQLGNGLSDLPARENLLPSIQNQSFAPASQISVAPVAGKKTARSEESTFLPNKKPRYALFQFSI